MRNTGKPSEEEFDKAWARLGKKAHVFTPTDAAKATGLNKKKTQIEAQPSDRIVTHAGRTFYAEIKSTIDEARFEFSLLRKTQSAHAAGVLAAGGTYDVFVHALAYDRWYRVPYQAIQLAKGAGRGSIPWVDLTPYAWSFPK